MKVSSSDSPMNSAEALQKWRNSSLFSPTSCSVGSDDLLMTCSAPADMAIEPDDIDVSDSAVFVWEIR